MSLADTSGKTEQVKKYRLHETDTGSPEVQIALLTQRVESLSEHFKKHVQDIHSQRGMMRLVSRRKSLLQYLKDQDIERYKKVLGSLGLRK